MFWFQKGLDALALVYALLFFPAPIFWLMVHPAIHFWRRFGNRSFWLALPVWLVSGIALVAYRHHLFSDRINRNKATWILGLALLLLATWINHHVYREFGLRRLLGFPEMSPDRYPGGVVNWGIYARVRHPRYLAYMLTFIALALLTGAMGFFALAIITILLYQIVTPLEERELREHYGREYAAYAELVPRFLPRLRRKPEPQ